MYTKLTQNVVILRHFQIGELEPKTNFMIYFCILLYIFLPFDNFEYKTYLIL